MILSDFTSQKRALEGAVVLVVDDDPGVLAMMMSMLRAQGCRPIGVETAEAAWQVLQESVPDAVLLDVHLPGMTGHEFLRRMRADAALKLLPVVMVTGSVSREDRVLAASAGVSVYLLKPFDAEELSLRLSKLIEHKRIIDAMDDAVRIMVSLARTVEARDPYTHGHSERVSRFAADMGRELRLSAEDVRSLEHGGLVHDIGKVGIRDHVLLKEGALTAEERRTIQLHPEIGRHMVESLHSQSHLLGIIHYHHERIDGSGYPQRLAGEAIPLLARITAYADVYDAVSTLRPYRPAYSKADSMDIVRHDAARRHLDPALLSAFESVAGRWGEIPVAMV